MALKAGVIGLRMGAAHAAAYARNPHTDLCVVCDVDEERAAAVAAEHGARAVTDYRALIEADVDIVSVASPDRLHPEHCIAALHAGKHVLCEKPLALTMDECRAIIAAADASGAVFMVGQVCRFAPGFVLAKSLIDDGLIGNLFLAESEYAHNYTHARGVGDWRVDPLRHPFVGGGCHAVDLVRWIAGNVAEVHAYANHFAMKDWPVDDCTVANLRFESGVIGSVMCSIGCRRPYTMRSCFYGDAGTIVTSNTAPTIQVYSTRYPTKNEFWELPVDLSSHNVASEVDELVSHIRGGTKPPTDAREGARTVATCLAAVESAASGQPVQVPNDF
ncbi:MAG: Gfo/Idh/MocA family oxidoreductase [Candidatus Hydrogenedentes bacterium]|nr:Gfo/Idh/MocA family oxidoreductase [Candidatus Hydrogenedentota bacterium]